MKLVLIVLWILTLITWGMVYYTNKKYPSGASLQADEEGFINHPKYGKYKAVIPFEPGMDIMPGQSAIVNIEIRIHLEEKP